MQIILASILLACSTNIDNLAVGIIYGIRNLKINVTANLLIACFSGLSTYFSMSLGNWFNSFFNNYLGNRIGSTILIIIGCLTIIKFFQPNSDLNSQANNFLQSEANKDVSLKEAAVIGMALTITNLGTGISAGIAQLDLLLTSLFSSATSIILISLGNLFGDLINSILSRRKLEFISGFLLICLGLFELVA